MNLGIDFGGTNIKLGMFSEDASVIKFQEQKVAELLPDELLTELLRIIKEFIEDEKFNRGGLAIKGLVDRERGAVINDIGVANYFASVNLRDILEHEFGFPFIIDNDARAYAFGEYKFGAGKGFNSIVVLTLGTGAGCSAVINNRLYYSNDPFSGILGGHLSIDRNGPECPCGSRGCLELYCSATAFKKIVLENHPELKNEAGDVLKTFFKKVEDKIEYQKTLNEFQKNLALGIVNLIHAYGPEAVIIGGGIMNSSEIILPEVLKMVNTMAWTHPRGKVTILPSMLGNKAAAIGAAFLE